MNQEMIDKVQEVLDALIPRMDKVTKDIKDLNQFANNHDLIIDWIGNNVLSIEEVCIWRLQKPTLIPPKIYYKTGCGTTSMIGTHKGNICPKCSKKIYDLAISKFKV